MKPESSAAAFAALLLHGALVAAVVIGLSAKQDTVKPPIPIAIELVTQQPPAPPTPLPITPPAPPSPPEKKRPERKPQIEPKAAAPAPARELAPQAPDVSFDPKPSASSTSAVPSPSAPPAPVAPAAPPKTSVSIASYAASNRKPPYPRMSRINEEQGTVVLRVLVKVDGTAGTVELKRTSGYPLLDESARSTVTTWRFNPATVDGKPVAEWYEISIPFKLQDN